MQPFDLAVIGAGPAGLTAAITAAEQGAHVAVLECLPAPGRKLLASGAGKCNLTNVLGPEAMAARFAVNPRFVSRALRAFPSEALRGWFEMRGMPTRTVDGFHFFPVSERAADVLAVLLGEAARLGVTLKIGCPATELMIRDGRAAGVRGADFEFAAASVLLASGGMGYPALGGHGSGYQLAAQAGHRIATPVPALVGLRTAASWPGELAGLVLEHSRVRFGKRTGEGELLFTRTGVSGPAILDLSGEVNRALLNCEAVTLEIELLAGLGPAEWKQQFEVWQRTEGKKQLKTLLGMKFSARFTGRLIELGGNCGELRAAEIPAAVRDRFIALLTRLPLAVTGSDGWPKAMATTGGVESGEVRTNTLESRLLPGLRFAGEVLDVGAPCGGYNLQWAFSSGRLAGALR